MEEVNGEGGSSNASKEGQVASKGNGEKVGAKLDQLKIKLNPRSCNHKQVGPKIST